MKTHRVWVITGGHHNSALVVAQELVKRGDHVFWLGHRHAASRDKSDSAEYQEVTKSGIPFHELKAGKVGEGGGLLAPLRVVSGIARAHSLLGRLKPSAVISFGGYLGFAAGVAAFLRGIPLFIHEQTVVAGKSNKILSILATKVYLTWGSSLAFLPRGVRSLVVGLPLRPSFLKNHRKKLFDNGKPTLLILGGKQGSHVLNKMVMAHLSSLTSRYNLIHQTGTNSYFQDYEKSLAHKTALFAALSTSYHPLTYLDETELTETLAGTDLYIGRSGAHTTYELGVKGIRSVLIPYLLTHDKEQQKNAQLLKSNGLAIILAESQLSFPALNHAISKMLKARKFSPLPLPLNATQTMCDDMQQVLGD